ncbi:MAG: ABC transporter ATP-binding protein [Clostridiales bacterium]|nr:ABC transporter ATP-binding protein [Clostridiales bacterium]
MEAINLKNICKNYKKITALNNVGFNVEQGELFGLLGVNGAGKTTLIKILCGLTQKTSGSAKVGGFDLDTQMQQIKQIIAISPQESSVAPNLTVLENLNFFAKAYGVNDANLLEEIIKTFKLEEVLDRRAKTLSGGFKRRLSIALALVCKPKILFLDEPTLGLDVLARRELWKIISKLKNKITIVLTSHYLEEIEQLCDRVAILSKGKLLQIGTVEQLKQKAHATTFEDAFVKFVEADNE